MGKINLCGISVNLHFPSASRGPLGAESLHLLRHLDVGDGFKHLSCLLWVWVKSYDVILGAAGRERDAFSQALDENTELLDQTDPEAFHFVRNCSRDGGVPRPGDSPTQVRTALGEIMAECTTDIKEDLKKWRQKHCLQTGTCGCRAERPPVTDICAPCVPEASKSPLVKVWERQPVQLPHWSAWNHRAGASGQLVISIFISQEIDKHRGDSEGGHMSAGTEQRTRAHVLARGAASEPHCCSEVLTSKRCGEPGAPMAADVDAAQ
ncbi:hypothetical protein CB1_000235004 [Camelus ferus]|nr:hypothetical protein CB1_000235004 [Camelus ferus]